ncbi:hypothetical protein [Streptomyces clavifer]|uniref:hypothetical protein n=1 Tax=Streptomyces clavifer TaxID=68188 RepID=UPI00369A0731
MSLSTADDLNSDVMAGDGSGGENALLRILDAQMTLVRWFDPGRFMTLLSAKESRLLVRVGTGAAEFHAVH